VFLSEIKDKCEVLDIGIGTAKALSKNAVLIAEKGIKICGIDINLNYITHGKRLIKKQGLQKYVHFHCISIYDEDLPKVITQKFDAAYFSASFSLMPKPVEALKVCK
jgi:ubiquinone/menaquinone biosynthesis C-methylase UbiE